MIKIDTNLFLLLPLLLLIFPLDWIWAVIIASVFHELMHILTVYALNGRILKMKIMTGGCVIESDFMREWKQFLSILAGPLGSLSLLLLCHTAPKVAICGLFQGVYNLIPVLPLDGGRLLRMLLERLCPKNIDFIMFIAAMICCVIVSGLAIWVNIRISRQIWLLILALVWNARFLPRKIPCKQS